MKEERVMTSSKLISAFHSLNDRGDLDLTIPKTGEEAQRLYKSQSSQIRTMIEKRVKELEQREREKREETIDFPGYEDARTAIGDGRYIAAMMSSTKNDIEPIKMWLFEASDDEKAIDKVQKFRDHYADFSGHKNFILGWLAPYSDGIKFRIISGECLCSLDEYTDCSYVGSWGHEYKSPYSPVSKSPYSPVSKSSYGVDSPKAMTSEVMSNISLGIAQML